MTVLLFFKFKNILDDFNIWDKVLFKDTWIMIYASIDKWVLMNTKNHVKGHLNVTPASQSWNQKHVCDFSLYLDWVAQTSIKFKCQLKLNWYLNLLEMYMKFIYTEGLIEA